MRLDLWKTLLERLSGELDPEEHQVWIAPLVPLKQDGQGLTLGCPHDFHRRWVQENYLSRIRELAAEVGGGGQVRLEVLPGGKRRASEQAATRQMELRGHGFQTPNLNRRYLFDTFVAGGGNEFACAAAKALAQGKGLFSNSLFLVSGTGLGKSHLTQAVGHYLLESAPGTRVAYLTAEDFANQMVSAIRRRAMPAFHERFRRECDVLLLEEVQFLAGKEKTQDELVFTLDCLMDAGKKIVFTGQEAPGRLNGLKKSLESRLSGAMPAAIDPPDHQTRVRILAHLCAEEGESVDREVLEYMAQHITDDVRRLQSALVGLLAKSSLTKRPKDLNLAAEILGQLHLRLSRVTPEQIRDLVAKAYGLEAGILTGKSRKKTVTRPRNLAMFLCRRHTEASYSAIGRIFNRDHATVMYGVGKVDRDIIQEPKLAQELAFLEQRLGVGG